MWDAMLKRGMSIPQLSDQESADLFAYFFAAQFSEGRGNAAQGLSVFRSKRCGDCHGIGKPVKSGIQPVTAWPALRDPIALASDMWNHSEQMRSELDNARISQPRLSSGDLVNLMAYLHSLPEVRRAEVDFSPASAEGGQRLYAEKGCAGCHEGARALEARPTLFTLTDFAATMWNHAFRVPVKPVPLDYLEMRQIVGYMVSMQFFEERGEMEEGKRVYRNKGCGRCHDDAASAAPPRSAMAGRMTSFQIAAALWKHGPAMRLRMRQRGISWPRFNGSEMADLSAFLHGLEFKKRATGAARPGTPKK
jgi:cytochrome c551/c552